MVLIRIPPLPALLYLSACSETIAYHWCHVVDLLKLGSFVANPVRYKGLSAQSAFAET